MLIADAPGRIRATTPTDPATPVAAASKDARREGRPPRRHGDGAMKHAGREHWGQKRSVRGEAVTAVPAGLDLLPPGRPV